MYDIISIGNISIDLFFKGQSLTYKDNRFQLAVGGKYFADAFHTDIGGGGANVAIGCARYGLQSAVLGTIGDNPFKHLIQNKLNEAGVSYKLCPLVKNYYNISSIFLTEKGERSIVHYAANHQNLFNSVSDKSVIKTKYVYLGNLENIAIEQRFEFTSFAKRTGTFIICNLGVNDCRRPKAQIEKLLQHVDVLIVNGHEFADLVKAPYADIHFHENIVEWYVPNLKDKLVVVTDSGKGSFAYFRSSVLHQKAIKPKIIVDTTGAGDSYTSAFISNYFHHRDIKLAMEKGAIFAAKNLEKIGAN